MFHMLSCFNLKSGVSINDFKKSLVTLDKHLQDIDLIDSTGSIGRRQRHRIMDTDDERDHKYFFIMTFRDLSQCDRSIDYVYSEEEPGNSIHQAVWHKVDNPVFICWEDI
tara:strand:- start:606 stop:935 length:330 start_codon:yes stop_codon:yes gene_type:complete